jgi:hypothetical protein
MTDRDHGKVDGRIILDYDLRGHSTTRRLSTPGLTSILALVAGQPSSSIVYNVCRILYCGSLR